MLWKDCTPGSTQPMRNQGVGENLQASHKMPVVTPLGVPGLPGTQSCKTIISLSSAVLHVSLSPFFEFGQVRVFLTKWTEVKGRSILNASL
jgi:hypothetical protein